jgi:putative ABC transport system substrate-binding protein
MILRRKFITLLGGAAAWPLAARAQQRTLPVIGLLGSTTAVGRTTATVAFIQGLKEAGFVDGQNVLIEARWADDRYDQLPAMADELVRARVALIAAIGNSLPARAAKSATPTIPIVFTMGADPVQLGLVASLNKPGGNITGVTGLSVDINQKRLQLLHDLLPNAKVFGHLINPDNLAPSSAGRTALELAQETARLWGVTVEAAQARTVPDFDAAFVSLAEKRIEGLLVGSEALFTSSNDRLVALAAQHRIPAVYNATEAARAGGLMSYTASITDTHRQAGRYAGRILKGEKPADLPVLLPTKFEFVINLKTARTLRLTVPPGLMAIAGKTVTNSRRRIIRLPRRRGGVAARGARAATRDAGGRLAQHPEFRNRCPCIAGFSAGTE